MPTEEKWPSRSILEALLGASRMIFAVSEVIFDVFRGGIFEFRGKAVIFYFNSRQSLLISIRLSQSLLIFLNPYQPLSIPISLYHSLPAFANLYPALPIPINL